MDPATKQFFEEKMEHLAEMIAKGFAQTATKVELNNLHAEMNERFERVDERFEHVDARFEKIDERLEKIDGRLDVVEGMLNRRYEEIDDLRGDIHDVKIRVGKLEALVH